MVIATLLVAIFTSGCGKQYVISSGFKDNEIFRIDKMTCTKAEFLVYLTNTENQYTKAYGEEFWNQNMDGKSAEEAIMQSVLAKMIKVKMMNLLAANYEIELTEQEEDRAKQVAKSYFDSLDDVEIEAFDKIKEDEIETMYLEYALADKVYHSYTDNVHLEISDDEARTIVVKQIFIPFITEDERSAALERINAANASIQAGNGFEVVAAEYNEATEDTLEVRKGQLEPAAETVVFNMSEGLYSNVVEGNNGYYLFYCVSAFDEATVELTKQKRVAEYKQQAFDSIYNVFVAEKDCVLNQEVWEAITSVRSREIDTADFFELYEVNDTNDFINGDEG